jgi:nucleotide-binding universal stress UspA family protein
MGQREELRGNRRRGPVAPEHSIRIKAFYRLLPYFANLARRRRHHHEEAVLKEIVELADREGRSIRTALRLDVSPEDAILRQARLGHYNLIVLGVGRPAGEALFFGKVAAASGKFRLLDSFCIELKPVFLL